jgi:hypothetical protein
VPEEVFELQSALGRGDPVEVASAEGEPGQTTIWVAKDSRKAPGASGAEGT